MNIYISSLSFSIKDDELRDLFTPFGEVSSAKVINDRETGRSRGFGFVTMDDSTAAQTAIEQLNGSSVDGRSIKVAEAMERTERSNSDGGFRKNNNKGFNNW